VQPNSVVHAAELSLELEPVPEDQSVEGTPGTGVQALTEFGGLQIGVWEMSPGVMTDIEVDEVFVVLSGSASVEFTDGSPALQLNPGAVVRLAAGARTTWTVHQTLRKVYLS
jgi:uncharacterized cupin superfamily protein